MNEKLNSDKKQMAELEFHRRRFDMLANIILGFEEWQNLIDLSCNQAPKINFQYLDAILDGRNAIDNYIAEFEKLYDESLLHLKQAGVEHSFLVLTREQWIQYEEMTLQRYHLIPKQLFYKIRNMFRVDRKT